MRVLSWLAGLVCLFFVATLSDTAQRGPWRGDDAASRPRVDPARAATLIVRVVDEDGHPVAGARADAYAVMDTGAVAVTGGAVAGDDGRAEVTPLPEGEAWVIVRDRDRARVSRRLVLTPGERRIDVTLGPAASFEVVVVDPLQRPIRGMTVSLFSRDPLPFAMTTDSRGLARFEGLPSPGPYAVEVRAAGYDQAFFPELYAEDSPLFVKLVRLGGLEVTVLEPGGAPAAGATVIVAGSGLWPARTATADPQGEVSIQGLPRGFYDVRAERGDLVTGTESGVMLEQGEREALTLTLQPGRWVTVHVTEGEGDDATGVADADVALVEDGISSFPRYGRTDASGHVILGPTVGDGATVSARADGYVARSAVALEPGQREVTVALQRGGRIVGRVVDAQGFPVGGASLEVVGVDTAGMPIADSNQLAAFRDDHFASALPGPSPLIPAGELGVMPIVPAIPLGPGPVVVRRSEPVPGGWVSDAKGEFTLSPVTPGQVRILARHPAFVLTTTDTFELVAGGETEVEVVLEAGGILEGRVVEEDGAPVAGARVEVDAPTHALGRVTFTAEDGSFAFAALPSLVTVAVARNEAVRHVVARETFEVPADGRREVDIVLRERRATLRVRVVDDRGYPVEDAEINVSSLVADEVLIKTLFADEAGEATLDGAEGLPLRVVVRRNGWAPHVEEVMAAPSVLELSLQRGLTVVGAVETSRGFVADAALTLLTAAGERAARTDAEGRFRIEELAPGSAQLLVVKKGLVPEERVVVVEGDGRRDVDLGTIDMVEGGTVSGVVRDPDGDPLTGVRVAAGRVPTFLPLGRLPLGVVETDGAGRFTLSDLMPGRYEIQAYKVGFGRNGVTVDVDAGRERSGIPIALEEDPDVDLTAVRTEASLAVTLASEVVDGGRHIVFEHVPYGGEAQRAGILPGDRLIALDGTPVRTLEVARRRLSGPLTSDMVLTLARPPDFRWRVRVRRERLRR